MEKIYIRCGYTDMRKQLNGLLDIIQYKSAYLYEQIRKMHELQEEYLVVVRYDVKSYGDLFRLKLRL